MTMSAIHLVVAKQPDESLAEVVARRLRGYLAEHRISHKDFGEAVGWDRGKYQRRLSGEVSLDLRDLEEIERATGITVAFMLTGVQELPPRPPNRSAIVDELPQVIQLRPIKVDDKLLDSPEIVDEDAAQWLALAEERPSWRPSDQPDDQASLVQLAA